MKSQKYGATYHTSGPSNGELINIFPVADDWNGYQFHGYAWASITDAAEAGYKTTTLSQGGIEIRESAHWQSPWYMDHGNADIEYRFMLGDDHRVYCLRSDANGRVSECQESVGIWEDWWSLTTKQFTNPTPWVEQDFTEVAETL